MQQTFLRCYIILEPSICFESIFLRNFSVSLRQGDNYEEEEITESEETYFKPEPYQQEQPNNGNNNDINGNESENTGDGTYKEDDQMESGLQQLNERKFMSSPRGESNTMWQSLMDQKATDNMINPIYHPNEINSFDFMDNMVSSTTIASDRMDNGNDLRDGISVYPVYTVPPQTSKEAQRIRHRPDSPTGYASFRSNILPSIQDPLQQLTPIGHAHNKMMHAGQGRIPSIGGGIRQVNRPGPSRSNRRSGFMGNKEQGGQKHMNPFLEPPPPRRSWADPSGWRISSSNLLVPTGRSVGLDFGNTHPHGANLPAIKDRNMVSVVVTPAPEHMPNTIPMKNNVQARIMHKNQNANRRSDGIEKTNEQQNRVLNAGDTGHGQNNLFSLHGLNTVPGPPTFTAQQILHQQIKNKQIAVQNTKSQGTEGDGGQIGGDGEEMVMQSSSDQNQFMKTGQNQFWATISSRNKESLAANEAQQTNDNILSDNNETGIKIKVSDVDSMGHDVSYSSGSDSNPNLSNDPLFSNGKFPRPKLRFGPSTPSPMTMPNGNEINLSQNQFMNQDIANTNTGELTVQNGIRPPIQVNNPGSSGLQVVEATVPVNQNSNSFTIGGSLSFGGGKENGVLPPSSMSNSITVLDNNGIQPEIGVYPSGYDSNILHPKQVPTGRPLQQGPHGPIVPAPRPATFPITQTPSVPQVLMNSRKHPAGASLIPSRLGTAGGRPHQNPGPGSYQPPITNTPNAMKGNPDSGQQLIKHYLMERKQNMRRRGHHIAKKKQMASQIHPRYNDVHSIRPSYEVNSNHASSTIPPPASFDMNQPDTQENIALREEASNGIHQNYQSNSPPSPASINRNGFYAESPLPNRRQDPISAAVAGAAIPAAAALGAISSGLTPVSIFSNLLNAYATLDSKHDITSRIVESASSWLTSDGQEVQASSDFGSGNQESTTLPQMKLSNGGKYHQTERASERSSTSTTTEEYNENDPYKAIIVESDGLPPVRSNVGFSQPLRPKPPSDGVFRVTPSPNYYPSSNSKIIQTPKYGVNNPHYFTENVDSSNKETAYGPDDFVVETVKLDKDFFHQFFTSKPLLLGTNVVTSTSVKMNARDTLMKRGRDTADEMPQVDIPVVNSSTFIKSKLHEMAKYHSKKESRSRQNLFESQFSSTTKKPVTTKRAKTTNIPEIKTKSNVKVFKRYYIPPEVKINHGMNMPY